MVSTTPFLALDPETPQFILPRANSAESAANEISQPPYLPPTPSISVSMSQQADSLACAPSFVPFTPPLGPWPLNFQGTTFYTIPPPPSALPIPGLVSAPPFHGYYGNGYSNGPGGNQNNSYWNGMENGNGNGNGNGSGNGFGQPSAPINGYYGHKNSSSYPNFYAPVTFSAPAPHTNPPFMGQMNHVRDVQFGYASQPHMYTPYAAAPVLSGWYQRASGEWKKAGKKRQSRKKYGNKRQSKKEEEVKKVEEITDGELNGINGLDGDGNSCVSSNGVLPDDVGRVNGDGGQTEGCGPRNGRRHADALRHVSSQNAVNCSGHVNENCAVNSYHHHAKPK